MWAGLSDEELVRSSDLIVLAEWRETLAPSGSAAPAIRTGSLAVSEVLKGTGKPATVRVVQLPVGALAAVGIWFFVRGIAACGCCADSPTAKTST